MSAEEKNLECSLPKLDEIALPLSQWDKQFKTALEKGDEDEFFDELKNDFDKEDW